MFERFVVNYEKRRINRELRKINRLLEKNKPKEAEKIYKDLLADYRLLCKRATYLEKLSAYHHILSIYDLLTQRSLKERKPAEVKVKSKAEERIAVQKEESKEPKRIIIGKMGRKAHKAKAKKERRAKAAGIRAAKIRKIKAVRKAPKITKVMGVQPEYQKPAIAPEKEKVLPKEDKAYSKEALKTAFDEMYDYVEKKGSVSINQVASHLNITADRAEEWARILEEHGLIRIYYPAFTSTKLMSIGMAEKREGKARAGEEVPGEKV
ncbi:MAG TPA: hypothetical protein VJC00_02620 [Candidatus Nanoarchaeia archaeon]|nr:hypothetical protein [Candidatus Nanoarchaeia archaeon]